MTISALDNNTVKLITTTQIITSVSNAAKELIENALDANANNVEVNLTDHGATLIEVKDDGCGIAKLDAPYMALPAYTSKISNFSDLDLLETYGFRGEALYALSAVSDLTIVSKTEEEEVATSYAIDNRGCIAKSEPCHRARGTTVQVRQLFKQLPVRRQIITNPRKGNQDLKILESFIKSYAMCKFMVRMSYKVDNNVVFTKPGTSSLEEAVSCVLGKKVTSKMTWINIENEEFRMKLMLPLKESRNVSEVFQSGAQYIFVNNRPIKYKDLEKIVIKIILEAFEYDSSSKKKPIFLLHILTNARNIDVNLDPNKTSILFKEQQAIHDTLDTRIKDFYGIKKEVQVEENPCEVSISDYQDYSQREIDDDKKTEWPACKKRKLPIEENVDTSKEKRVRAPDKRDDSDQTCDSALYTNSENNKQYNPDLNLIEESTNTSKEKPMRALEKRDNTDQTGDSALNTNSENNRQGKSTEKRTNDQDKNNDVWMKDTEHFNVPLPHLELSESDSNDSQNFTLVCSSDDNSSIALMKQENDDDSPPFDLNSQDTLSQLPIVDLGDDFDWNDSLIINNADTNEKENQMQDENVPTVSREQNKSDKKKCVTLLEWSKGHVPGLKGGTNVQPCANSNLIERSESNLRQTNVCDGFTKFSMQMRSKVVEQNPDRSAAQIAHILTDCWKKLSSEERGYYRDLARDEKIERETEEKITRKCPVDNKKVRSRLLKALEKVDASSSERKENLLLKTIVPWDMDLKRVTENYFNNSSCTNSKLIVGIVNSEFYIVQKSAHLWLLNAVRLKKELNVSDTNINEECVSSMEQLLKKWFSTKDDLSLLHPLHALPTAECS
ncbi:uncharacterized protein LOC117229764 [Megalopta genalis]|uniref:uncharacterized protein LOC117229764 n=1 Tax=Megalopta genalis TaxID=115081 RepID=UPI003FD63C9F